MQAWARELIDLYESNAASQFVIHGNVGDRLAIRVSGGRALGSLNDFLQQVLLAPFDVVLTYDLGNGIRVEKGGQVFGTWPHFQQSGELPKAPRAAVETLTHYFRYCANLGRLKREQLRVGCIVQSADLLAPAAAPGRDPELGALVMLLRDWATDTLFTGHSLATFLITENLNDLHPLLANNPRAGRVSIPLPPPEELTEALELMAPAYPQALAGHDGNMAALAKEFTGATVTAIESSLRRRERAGQPLGGAELAALKKQLVERDAAGLIEFVTSKRTLNDVCGMDAVKQWLRQDIALWKKDDVNALPKGYLLCGPVGTGKTFLVECLAGEADVPMVKLKNFRDKWVGSTEGNLERIFRVLRALGKCYVFIDEADQALGRRDAGGNDSGLSGRIYSMIAEEMGSSESRGKIIWVLASSRPDLIEVDLKRPGRVDVKIPLLPSATPAEGAALLEALCRKRGVDVRVGEDLVPALLTPGAAEAIAVKIYRLARTAGLSADAALRRGLERYQSPVPADVMAMQIRLAVAESSDLSFVPDAFLP